MTATAQLLIFILSTWTLITHARPDTWRQVDAQCLPESAPVADQSVAISEVHCTMKAAALNGILVAQLTKSSNVCRIFRYRAVCRQLVLGDVSDCLVFLRFPIDARSMNVKLRNVWVADDKHQLENLFCQVDEDMNQFSSVSVQWNEDGVKLDGVSSRLIMNKSNICYTGGLTWLMRIKRQPMIQAYLESIICGTLQFTSYITSLWEFDSARMLHAFTSITSATIPKLFSPANSLPASPDEFVNIGFTNNAIGDSWGMFVGNSFLPNASLRLGTTNITKNSSQDVFCLLFGERFGDSKKFNGTLRALAVTNVSMTEAEIQQFFALVG